MDEGAVGVGWGSDKELACGGICVSPKKENIARSLKTLGFYLSF